MQPTQSTQTIYKPQHFPVNNAKLLFFDIFYKNNKIYMIMPIYNTPASPQSITVTINNNVIPIKESHVKDSNEPTLVYIYEYITPPNSIVKVNVSLIDNNIQSYELTHVCIGAHTHTHTHTHTRATNNFLALTTLLKHDYHLFPLFYNYYKEQGVDHFFMYYNGVITPQISKIFNKPDVTLVQWDFHYWNPPGVKYVHHAQMGQMHHALYKYGKDIYDYMIFCDMDEYLHVSKNKFIECIASDGSIDISNTLKSFIKHNPNIDIFGFCNMWADTIDGNIPDTPHLPKKFLSVTEPVEYLERSKNIYKVSSINTIGIHQIGYDFFSTFKYITDLKMYHFYKWSSKNRTIQGCTNIVELD